MSSGPSGRSPFPGRGRRRLSAELAATMDATTTSSTLGEAAAAAANNNNNNASASFTSPNISNLLSQSRLSPAAASGWSPMNQQNSSSRSNANARPRRFFESTTTTTSTTEAPLRQQQQQHSSNDGGVLATGIPFASMGGTTTTTKPRQDLPNALPHAQMMDGINLTRLRSLAQNVAVSTATPEISVFYASMLYAKTQSLPDAYLYAQTLAKNGQAMRSVLILERAGLLLTNTADATTLDELRLEAILLAAHSLAHMDEWSEALVLLESATQQGPLAMLEDDNDAGWQDLVQSLACSDKHATNTIHPVARLCVLRGRAHYETANPTRAALYWKRALRVDAKCVLALDLLLESNMLTPLDAHSLIASCPQHEEEEMTWLHDFLLARVNISTAAAAAESSPPPAVHASSSSSSTEPLSFSGIRMNNASSIQMATPSFMTFDENNQKLPPKIPISENVATAFGKLWTTHKLQKAPETLALAAVRAYRQYDLTRALDYCQQLTTIDPLCPTASFVHVATLLALNHKRLLFQLAHEWVQACPKSAHAWFAVGSYYYACGRYHVAQRHYCRATRLNPQCTEAWIAFGCSFSMSDETDQALASFRAAQRLAPAHNVPLLYMGMEYLRTNHLVLARHFLMAANKTSHGGDALCLHELGVADYQRREFETAAVWFQRSLVASSSCVSGGGRSSSSSASESFVSEQGSGNRQQEDPVELCQDVFWEPTLFNLGQCYRKSRQFGEAKRCFEKCLSLCPGSASCYSALAFTKHLSGDIDGAIEMYHQALSRKPDDPLSTEMLNRALQESLTAPVETTSTEDSQMTEPFAASTPAEQDTSRDARMFTPSFNFGTPNDSSAAWSGRRTRSSARRGLDLSIETDGNPDLSLDSDTDMSMS